MIELILYGAAGFLLAALLAFLIVPVLTDRAAKNATTKLKANLPFSTDEMEADKDQLKATHAVELRKVEINLMRARDRLTSQDLELRTLREQLEGSNKVGKASKLAMEEMRQKEEALNVKLREGDSKFAALEARARQLIREKNELQHSLRHAERRATTQENPTSQTTAIGTTLSESKTQLTSPGGLPIADEALALRRAQTNEPTDNADKLKELLAAERKRSEQLNHQLISLTRQHQELQQSIDHTISDAKAEIQAKYDTEISSLKASAAQNQILTDNTESEIITSSNEENITTVSAKHKQTPNPVDQSVLQDKLFDIAAIISKLTSTIEGDESIIHELLNDQENETENSLSHRIRKLMEATETASDKDASEVSEPDTSSLKPGKTKRKPITRKVQVQVPTPQKVKTVSKSKADAAKPADVRLPVTDPDNKAGAKKLSLPKAEGLVITQTGLESKKKANSDA